jgi:hypothetical protein
MSIIALLGREPEIDQLPVRSGRVLQCQFDDRQAKADLRSYRKKGPDRSTPLLLDALRAEGVEGASLLDIGGGVDRLGVMMVDVCHLGVSDNDGFTRFLVRAPDGSLWTLIERNTGDHAVAGSGRR